jgi:septal ring factor EnvC (AmiA/AmiB activator)
MWPKAIAQLIELLPHAARLLPVADKFFTSKTAGEEANRRAMESMSEGLRGDLGQVTASHAGLYRQLNDQSDKLAEISTDLSAVRDSAESTQARITHLEHRLDRIAFLLMIVTLIAAVLLILTVILLVRHTH